MKITVIIASDQSMFAHLLSKHIATIGGMKILANAATAADAIKQCEKLRPGLLLMPLKMSERDALSVMRALRASGLKTRVIAYATEIHRASIINAMRDSIPGLLHARDHIDEWHKAIEKVAVAGRYYSLTPMKIRAMHQGDSFAGYGLTPREVEVIVMVCEGMPIPEIATKLHIEESTVKNHKYEAMKKLDVHNSLTLYRKAVLVGIILPIEPEEDL